MRLTPLALIAVIALAGCATVLEIRYEQTVFQPGPDAVEALKRRQFGAY